MTYIWMLVPIVNALLFIKAPIASLIEDGQKGMSLKELFKSRLFWVLMLMMVIILLQKLKDNYLVEIDEQNGELKFIYQQKLNNLQS